MNNLKLLLNKKRIKQLLFLFWPLLFLLGILFIILLLGDVGKDGGWKTITGIICGICLIALFYIQLIVIYFYY